MAAKGALGRAAAWIGSSAVGYDTDLGDLAAMGAVSGLVLGLVLARFTDVRAQVAGLR